MEEPSLMVRSRVVELTSSRVCVSEDEETPCAVATVLSAAWRDCDDQVEPCLSLACVGPAYTVEVWDYGNGTVHTCALTYYGHSTEITALMWSPDTMLLASASEDHAVHIWDVATGHARLVYRAQTSAVRALAWSPDGSFLAVGSDNNTIHVVSLADQRASVIYNGHVQGCYGIDALAWSPDGRYVASAGDDNLVQVWDATTGEVMVVYSGHRDCWVLALAWSPDGRWIASGGDDIHVWSVETGECRQTYCKHDCAQRWIDCIAWSSDGDWLASTSTDRIVHIWDVWTGATVRTHKHTGREEGCNGLLASALAWLPHGSLVTDQKSCLAFASTDNQTKTVSLIRLL